MIQAIQKLAAAVTALVEAVNAHTKQIRELQREVETLKGKWL